MGTNTRDAAARNQMIDAPPSNPGYQLFNYFLQFHSKFPSYESKASRTMAAAFDRCCHRIQGISGVLE